MMPMHDPDGLRRRERELRDVAERTRRVRESRDGEADAPQAPPASITVLPELVAEEPCVACDLERERTA